MNKNYRVWEGATPTELSEIKETYISYLLELSKETDISKALLFLANIRDEQFTSYSNEPSRNEYYNILTYFCFVFEMNCFDNLLITDFEVTEKYLKLCIPKIQNKIIYLKETIKVVQNIEYKEILIEIVSQFEFIEKSIHQILNLPHQQTETKPEQASKPKFTPKQFSEIFYTPALVNDCIALLKETDKPCINDENGYIRNKGVFVVWFNALETKKMFAAFSNDVERAATLNHNFVGLNISESLFRAGNTRAKEFKSHFENQIAALKR